MFQLTQYVYTRHIFHLSVEAPLGCFHVLAITGNAAMNIGLYVPFEIRVFSGHMPKMGLLDHMVAQILVLSGTSTLLILVAIQIYIPTSSVGEFLFSTPSPAFIEHLLDFLMTILTGVR